MTAPKRDRAEYMCEYRARKRTGAGSAAAAPTGFDLAAMDLAAIAAPPAGDPDAVTPTVRLDDAQFGKVAALMRAARAHHGPAVGFDDAIRLAVEVAHRAIVGNGTAA